LAAYVKSDLRRPDNASTPQPPPTELPELLLRAVQGQTSGWTRLGRFAVTMSHPTIDAAAMTIGISRATLIEQLHRLETDLGQQLYHRATAAGQPQRPTTLGATLLNLVVQPDIQALRATRARLPRISASPAPPVKRDRRPCFARYLFDHPQPGSRSPGPVWLFPPVVRMIRGVLPPGRVALTDR
jgi:hypothetical protein